MHLSMVARGPAMGYPPPPLKGGDITSHPQAVSAGLGGGGPPRSSLSRRVPSPGPEARVQGVRGDRRPPWCCLIYSLNRRGCCLKPSSLMGESN